MLKIFLRDSVSYAVPALFSRSLSLILVPVYTRVLNPADYGSLDLMMIFASIANLTIALEVSQGLARFFASEPNLDRKVVLASTAFWFTCGCYALFTALMLVLSPTLASLVMGQAGLELPFKIGSVYISINGIFLLIQNQLRWELRSLDYALISLLLSIVTAIATFWLAFSWHLGLEGLLVGMLLGCLSATGLGLWMLRKSFRVRFDFSCLREMLAFSTPLVFSGFAIWASLYIDRIMINHFLSVDEVGLYGIGYRLSSIAGLITVGFQGALTPLIYAHYQKAETPLQIERIFRIFLAIALSVYLFLVIFSKDILTLFVTPAFYASSSVVIFLTPAILLSNMYIFSPGIAIAKKTHLTILINIAGAGLNFILNFILIPRFGIVGAGMANLISYFAIFLFYIHFGQYFYRIPYRWKPIANAVLIALAIAATVPPLQLPAIIRLPVDLVIYLAFLLSIVPLGLLEHNEINYARSMITTRLSRLS
jgi:O-antigen/teichoic acid export membrane protein